MNQNQGYKNIKIDNRVNIISWMILTLKILSLVFFVIVIIWVQYEVLKLLNEKRNLENNVEKSWSFLEYLIVHWNKTKITDIFIISAVIFVAIGLLKWILSHYLILISYKINEENKHLTRAIGITALFGLGQNNRYISFSYKRKIDKRNSSKKINYVNEEMTDSNPDKTLLIKISSLIITLKFMMRLIWILLIIFTSNEIAHSVSKWIIISQEDYMSFSKYFFDNYNKTNVTLILVFCFLSIIILLIINLVAYDKLMMSMYKDEEQYSKLLELSKHSGVFIYLIGAEYYCIKYIRKMKKYRTKK